MESFSKHSVAQQLCSECGIAFPGTPPRQQQRPRTRSSSPSPVRKPWVVAGWKHRVTKSDDDGCPSSPGHVQALQKEHRSELVAAHRKQLHADFSAAHDTINGMLQRCQLVEDTLRLNCRTKTRTSSGSSSSSPTASAWSSRSLQPSTPPLRPASAPHKQSASMRLTARSRIIFEAPASASPCHTPSSARSKGSSSSTARSSSGSTGTADISQQQDRQLACYGGCIDLNPGFAFRPGTAERTAAVLRHAGPAATLAGDGHTAAPTVAKVQAAVAAAWAPRLCGLTHREQLQVGIQQKNAAFYGAIRQQQWQQHQQQVQELWERAEVIPVSWFLGV